MIEDRIKAALAEREKKLSFCPVNKRGYRGGSAPCPSCHARPNENCGINTQADAAFVDTIKELVQ